MATLNEIIARAEALRKESYVNSIDPERVGSIMSDTLKYLNEFQLQSGSMGLDKIYASVSAMNSDNAPVSDLTGKPRQAVERRSAGCHCCRIGFGGQRKGIPF